jgi:hypothetical protein
VLLFGSRGLVGSWNDSYLRGALILGSVLAGGDSRQGRARSSGWRGSRGCLARSTNLGKSGPRRNGSRTWDICSHANSGPKYYNANYPAPNGSEGVG